MCVCVYSAKAFSVLSLSHLPSFSLSFSFSTCLFYTIGMFLTSIFLKFIKKKICSFTVNQKICYRQLRITLAISSIILLLVKHPLSYLYPKILSKFLAVFSSFLVSIAYFIAFLICAVLKHV